MNEMAVETRGVCRAKFGDLRVMLLRFFGVASWRLGVSYARFEG